MKYSIVNYSDINRLSDYRIDSEYWQPELIANAKFISSDKKIRNFVEDKIDNISTSPINKDFEYLEISNISIRSGEYKTVTISAGKEPQRAHHILRKNDVVVSTVRPNRNAAALINKDGVIGTSGLCVLRVKGINPKYLYIFCKTNYFIKCLIRANKATMYPAVSNADILDTPITILSSNSEKIIVNLVDRAFDLKHKSKSIYTQAEEFLLLHLGLNKEQLKHQLSFVESYSKCNKNERIDAEYYQPKYDNFFNSIKNCSARWDTLSNIVNLKKGIEVGKDEYTQEGIPFVRVSNISPFEITEGKYISEKLYNEYKLNQPEKGEILLSKDATTGIAHHLNESSKRMIVASGILRLINRSNKVKNEYLTLVLNSMVTKTQARRDATGSIILHWIMDHVKETVIPILPEEKQIEIQKKINEAINLYSESNKLISLAKQFVDIAIEKNEKEAMRYIQANSFIYRQVKYITL